MGEYFGRCERCGGTQNIAGDPCFFSNGRGTQKYRGELKKCRGRLPEGTSTGSVLEGCNIEFMDKTYEPKL